jgi:hypothetical protein
VLTSAAAGVGLTQATVVWGELTGGTGTISVTESDLAGCEGTVSQTVNYLTNGVEWAAQGGLQLYPNPVRDRLQVVVPAGIASTWRWTLQDATGRQVREGDASASEWSVDCGDLGSGLYWLRLDPAQGLPALEVQVSVVR